MGKKRREQQSSIAKMSRSASMKVHPSFVRPAVLLEIHKFYQILSPIFEEPIQEAIMREVIWTEEEMCNRMKDFEKGSGSSFWEVLISRVRSSIAGQFIKEFNKGGPVNQQLRELQLDCVKATILDPDNQEEYESLNDIVDDMVSFLREIIRSEGDQEICFQTFLRYLGVLRLRDSKIGSLDKHMNQLNNLQVLVLTGNVIEELRFDFLPASLRIFELNNNLISEIKIKRKIAPQLIYLGLSSNCFSDESKMEGLTFLNKLCVLDLSDNNFSSFLKVANIISDCTYLEGIFLKGNPLSTVASYKEIIKISSPNLHQLDGASLTYEPEKEAPKKIGNKELNRKNTSKKDRFQEKKLMIPAHTGFCYTAELRIHVFRMMGIPKPYNKNKKLKGYFQFEVELPLLDPRHKVQKKCNAMFQLLRQCKLFPKADEFPPPQEVPEDTDQKLHERKSPKSEKLNRKHTEKMRKKEPWEFEYEEFLANDKQEPDASRILSEKIRWGLVMKPNGPIATIPVNSGNLGLLRYTLKSIIVIRLYFNYEVSKDDSNTGKRLIAKISVPAQEPHWKEDFCSYEWNAKQPQIAFFRPPTSHTKIPFGSRGKQKAKISMNWTAPNCQLGIALHRVG
ncbi:unnamed protein product [Nezara viridula]|uniref:Uncharacterized protein n=1 Tax=Nezara viridula TaxID=85310 RepID=A0A9P0E6M4_NEZVI|nr:unnamed protein product [Nezara viridula]